jgi:putative ABC transport system permease protein
MYIRIIPGSEKQVVKSIQQLWQQFYLSKTLSFTYMTHILEKEYRVESKFNTLFIFFTLLAIFISCLGLFGLVSITLEQRTKEIGIRKVLGAEVGSILNLISKDFLKLVLFAILIASPIAWYLLNKWLMDYPYRVQIQFWMFALAGLTCVAIALLTISLQTVKVALANPIKALRDD